MAIPIPVAYWPLNEVSGNAQEFFENYDATEINTPGTASDLDGTVRAFVRASSESFEVADNAAFSFVNQSFAISIWAKFNSLVTGGNYEGLLSKFNTSGGREWGLYYEGTQNKLRFTITNNAGVTDVGGILDYNTALSTGVWYHFVAQYDHAEGEMRLYVNGALATQKDYALGSVNSGSKLCIGRLDNLNSWVDGYLARALLFGGVVLTEEQIEELHDSPTPSFVDSMTLDCGIGGCSATGAKYRLQTGINGTNIAIEYSANSDLSSSATGGASTTSGTYKTGGGSITGLTPNTRYYYSFLVNGERQHSSPFPSFLTACEKGILRIPFSSCNLDPDNETIFATIAALRPHCFLHLGDNGYPDSTAVQDQLDNYAAQRQSNMLNDLMHQTAVEYIYDDHDYGPNDSDGDTAGGFTNSFPIFKAFVPTHTLANSTYGLWRKFTAQHAEFFIVDVRTQREGTFARFPTTSPTTFTADTGSSGSTLVLRSADSPSGTDDFYNGWYVKIGSIYQRVTDYVGTTRTCTLSAAVSGLSSSSTYFLKRASMLDQDNVGANNQVDWLIDGINNSSARWKIFATPVIYNKTIPNLKRWGDWDPEEMERNYLSQEIDWTDVVIISADGHWAGIDNAIQSPAPEITASPLNAQTLNPSGTWSNGSENNGLYFGLLEITENQLRMSVRDEDGIEEPAITPLVLTHSDPVARYPLLTALQGASL